ncbi:hypothetical protein [Frateuria defendens]|uniref:hypothetical protein n=1 Tax=Frateuria defendens TaxID=2219559 RepID=UPI001F2404E3|nr:hypothetical protein [Frateuria defendens]
MIEGLVLLAAPRGWQRMVRVALELESRAARGRRRRGGGGAAGAATGAPGQTQRDIGAGDRRKVFTSCAP